MIIINYETMKKDLLSDSCLRIRDKFAVHRRFNEYLRFMVVTLIVQGFQVEEHPGFDIDSFSCTTNEEQNAFNLVLPFWQWHETLFCNYASYDPIESC